LEKFFHVSGSDVYSRVNEGIVSLEWILRAHSSERAWRIRSREMFLKASISVGAREGISCGVVLMFAHERMKGLSLWNEF
jgi:hypothetical protein